MIKVTTSKSKKGHRLVIKNHNGEPFNHFYNRKSGAKRAWNSFIKQLLTGKVKFI